MRRLLVLIVLTTLLTGCAELRQTAQSTPEPVNYATPTLAINFPAETSTVARMQTRGEMVVGIRYDLEPLSYITPEGELAGLEIDLARELARRWLGDPNAVQFRQVRSDTSFQHILSGEVDFVLAGVTRTQQDEAQVDFSLPYFIDGQALLTFPETGIQSLADLEGRRVGTVSWTRSQSTLAAATPVSPTYQSFPNFFDAVEALRTRQVEVYADERHRLLRAQRMVAGTVIVGQYTQTPFAAVYRQNDPFFDNLITLTLQDLVRDGTLAALYDTWLPNVTLPAVARWPGEAPIPPLSNAPQTLSTVDVVARIQQRGVLAVGYFADRWPYAADRADGIPTGFEVRLVERIALRWFGSEQAVTFVPVTESDALLRLAQGEVDMLIGGWLHTRELELRGNCSISIYDDGVSLLTNANTPVEGLAALTGRSVGVIAGSAGEAALPEISQATGVGIAPVVYPTRDAAVAGLQQGEVAALLAERGELLDPLYRTGGFTLNDTRYTYRPLVFVLPEGDSDFRDLVNLTLMALQADGSYGELYRIWFDDPPLRLETWPGQPAIALRIEMPPRE